MRLKNRCRVAVLTGGPSNEHDVSVSTGKMVMQNLNTRRYRATEIRIQQNGRWQFLPNRKTYLLPKALQELLHRKFDVGFIALHGAFGEDGKIQALLESVGLPYTGSGVTASATAMDKATSNAVFHALGLRVPQYTVLRKDEQAPEKIHFPIIIKPLQGGSSVGITIARTQASVQGALRKVFREDSRVMLQQYIRGRELTCGVLEKQGEPFALTPTEIIPRSTNFFDYKAKYQTGGSKEITPPRLSKAWIRQIQAAALAAHRALGCRGMSRTDFILSKNVLYVLELNTIPGMTATSLLPQEAAHDGFSFSAMLDLIVAAALRRS